MSKKLHEEAIEAARQSCGNKQALWLNRHELRAVVDTYLAHLAAHGVKLTPRAWTLPMVRAGLHKAQVENYGIPGAWEAMHDASPDWPGDAE